MNKEIQAYAPIEINRIQFDLQKLYLNQNFDIAPIDTTTELTQDKLIGDVRFFHLTKFVYEKDIKISYKLSSVFTALHSVEASLLVKLISDGNKCDILIGVKSDKQITDKQKVLVGALTGNFPGSRFSNNKPISNDEVIRNNKKIFHNCKEITAVVGIPSIKNKDEEHFIQGIENLILGMNGKAFSALFIADPVHSTTVEQTIDAYEKIYSILSSEQELVTTDGTNESTSTSESFSTSHSISTSSGESKSSTIGESSSSTIGESKSTSEGKNKSTNISKQPWIGKKVFLSILGGRTKGTSEGTSTTETKGTNASGYC